MYSGEKKLQKIPDKEMEKIIEELKKLRELIKPDDVLEEIKNDDRIMKDFIIGGCN